MTARAAQCGCGVHGFAMNPCDSAPIATAPYYREARVTFARRQTACRMRHCCARRIVGTGGRRELGCTSTRWAERQRVVEAEANRIADSNAAAPRYGQYNRQALKFFELLACNVGPFSWGSKGDILSRERISPLSASPARCREQAFAPWQKQSLLLYYKRLRLDTITGNNVAVW